MKCQKCGYISFDHNEICPKCKKNISAVRDKMNLPPYKAVPLSLLGSLTGEGNDSGIGASLHSSEETLPMGKDVGLSPEEAQAIEAMEKTFNDSQEIEIELETTADEIEKDSPGVDIDDLSMDIEELPIEDVEIEALQIEPETDAGDFLEPEFSLSEDEDVEETIVFDTTKAEEESPSFDLDDLSRVESGPISEDSAQKSAEDEMPIDLETLASALEEPTGDRKADHSLSELEDLELDLDLEGLDDKSS